MTVAQLLLFFGIKTEPVTEIDSPTPDSFHYADIPTSNDPHLEGSIAPKVTCFYEAWTVEEIKNRYGELLHRLLDMMPFDEDDMDRLVIPVIYNFIRLVHLLPASESHHHSYSGGLIRHSIDCACHCLIGIQRSTNIKQGTYAEIHRNRDAWILAVVIVGICHDLGKLSEITVTTADGIIWNAENTFLLDWLKANRISHYLVKWDQTRKHKAHETRALRYMYRQVLPSATIIYLEQHSTAILDAIEDAIVGGQGPLGSILKTADGLSVVADGSYRKTFISERGFVDPRITPILNALKTMIVTTHPSVCFRLENSLLFKATDSLAASIREQCCSYGLTTLPSSISGLADILKTAQLLKTDDCGNCFISFYQGQQPIGVFWEFPNSADIFPEAFNLPIQKEITSQPLIRSTKNPVSQRFMPAQDSFEQIVSRSPKESSSPSVSARIQHAADTLCRAFPTTTPLLSAEELSVLPAKARTAKECRVFTERLLKTFFAQLAQGSGTLVGKENSSKGIDISQLLEVMKYHSLSIQAAQCFLTGLTKKVSTQWDETTRTLEIQETEVACD